MWSAARVMSLRYMRNAIECVNVKRNLVTVTSLSFSSSAIPSLRTKSGTRCFERCFDSDAISRHSGSAMRSSAACHIKATRLAARCPPHPEFLRPHLQFSTSIVYHIEWAAPPDNPAAPRLRPQRVRRRVPPTVRGSREHEPQPASSPSSRPSNMPTRSARAHDAGVGRNHRA
ncbi:hypothetical protein BC826DRAFT_686629 [Russula brevipes]|nr:hypothetical protein BC826DRAFT_686629 [Russula brevipes]